MTSIDFTRTRALATRSTQSNIAASWTWSKKTLAQWDADLTALDGLIADEIAKRVAWRNAAEEWQSEVDRIQEVTRQIAGLGPVQFQERPVAVKLFESLRTDGESRSDIYAQGLAAHAVWKQVDADWELNATWTSETFEELLASCSTSQSLEAPAVAAWRRAAAELNHKAEAIDRDNIAWYTEAARRFPSGSVEGDLIRANVPTTARPEAPVGRAIVSNLVVSGTDIRFDCTAEGATRFTFLQQVPGSSAFVVVLAESPLGQIALHGQLPGVHRFKAFGHNSRGQGPDSAVIEVNVAASVAA